MTDTAIEATLSSLRHSGNSGSGEQSLDSTGRSTRSSRSSGSSASRPKRCLLLLTGSVASIKAMELVAALLSRGFAVKVGVTSSAQHFVRTALKTDGAEADDSLDKLRIMGCDVYSDDDEWAWRKREDAVLHIQLRSWADIVVIAPLSANTLAKVANGLCDNLVTCVMRAWPWGTKPVVVAPAMNTAMWQHPVTAKNLHTLQTFAASKRPGRIETADDRIQFLTVGPVAKTLVCGDVGLGAMSAADDIANEVAALMCHRVTPTA